MNYSEVETKVREATNDDAWGPHGSAMAEIAQFYIHIRTLPWSDGNAMETFVPWK